MPCVRCEMTQQEFRGLRGEKWSPSFIAKFGAAARRLYKQIYEQDPPKKDPPEHWLNSEKRDPVNLYPYGILDQTYRRLIEAGEQLGEPYREPDPSLTLQESDEREPPTGIARRFSSYERVRELVKRKVAERVAAANALARKTYGQDFDQLDPDKRSAVLRALDESRLSTRSDPDEDDSGLWEISGDRRDD